MWVIDFDSFEYLFLRVVYIHWIEIRDYFCFEVDNFKVASLFHIHLTFQVKACLIISHCKVCFFTLTISTIVAAEVYCLPGLECQVFEDY